MLDVLLLLAVSASTVLAAENITSYTSSPVDWVYPPSRGFDASTASVYPCGGIDPGTRTSYPLTGGEVSINSDILAANVNLLYVNMTDPTLFHDFSTWTDSILDMSVGDYCTTAPDFTTFGAGTNVTLLIIWQFYGTNESTYYYNCADLTLVDNSEYTAPTSTCTNSSVILDLGTDDNSLVLHGTNYTGDAAGGDGQDLNFTSTPTASATSVVSAVYIEATSTASGEGDAHESQTTGAATSSAATSAAATSSSTSTSGALLTSKGGALGAAIGFAVCVGSFLLF